MQSFINRNALVFAALGIIILYTSCGNNIHDKNTLKEKKREADSLVKVEIRDKIMTAEEQKNLTPALVIQRLKDGNKLYLANDLTERDHSALVKDGIQGQFPMAVVLACMDSRVPVEDVFDCAPGDLFVCRIAGNVINEDMLGSLEYGCKVAGAKVIVVMGHRYCGAIKSAVKNVKLGNITNLLDNLKPAIAQLKNFTGEKNYNNEKYLTAVTLQNIQNVVKEIKQKSPVLKAMADKGELSIVGAGYDLNDGAVIFFQ